MAEREGFEPSEPVRVHLISNQAHSATLSSLLIQALGTRIQVLGVGIFSWFLEPSS